MPSSTIAAEISRPLTSSAISRPSTIAVREIGARAQLVEVAALDVLDQEQRRRAERGGQQQRLGSWNAP